MAVIQRVIDANGQKALKVFQGTLHTAADTDRIVATTNMKVGAYDIAAQPYCPSLITVTTTAGGTADTQGTIVVVGTDIFGTAQTDTITPVAGTTVSGTKYFKTVTSVTGVGWVINATGPSNDTIVVGVPASGGLYTKGHPVTVGVITGNIWLNPTTTAVADVTSVPFIAGDTIQNMVVDTLSLISDSSGGTFYAIVWDTK
jgi:hypothetical protein